MKILKPGKAKKLKLTCPNCGCEFLYEYFGNVYFSETARVICPQEGCKNEIFLRSGTPYEEPTPTQTDRERLIKLLDYNFGYTDEIPAATLADNLIANGVTFREG